MSHDGGPGSEPAGGPAAVQAPRRRRRRALTRWVVGLVLLVVVSLVGFVVFQYFNLSMGIKRSDVLSGSALNAVKSKGAAAKDTNILIMGLDSRLDENGNPLPQQIYDALHAGGQADGGLNANVLMLLHVPGNGSKATEISIPRDDYASLVGCPDGECMGKIKQAYGLAFDQESKKLAGQSGLDSVQRQQKERDAGRSAQIATVSKFLGGVPIDHFVEVTLVSFYEIAQVVQPITVCVNANTQDTYSGANFHKGYQQINASQALAFVRQRRDDTHPSLNFTDLDRERRQQAFIASLAYQLKQANTFTNPIKMSQIIDVAKQNTAIDSGLNVLALAQQASSLTGGNVTFYTLPIDHFGKDPLGEDVNYVNLPQIQATVRQLLYPAPRPSATQAPSPLAGPRVVVGAINASGRPELLAELRRALSAGGFSLGKTTTATPVPASLVEYGAGADKSAFNLALTLGGMPTQRSAALAPGGLRVVIAPDFAPPTGAVVTPSPSPTATAVPGAGPGVVAPPPTALSALSGGGIQCVK
jgi:LCP family protein required for cell wall assembly